MKCVYLLLAIPPFVFGFIIIPLLIPYLVPPYACSTAYRPNETLRIMLNFLGIIFIALGILILAQGYLNTDGEKRIENGNAGSTSLTKAGISVLDFLVVIFYGKLRSTKVRHIIEYQEAYYAKYKPA